MTERFWEKVAVVGATECWNWTGTKNDKSRGRFWAGRDSKGWKACSPSRLSWVLANGPIPDGVFVLHTCDNGLCVNPAHLYLGNRLDNARDAVVRGQHPTGERHGNCKVSDNALAEILAATGSSTAIAARFGISASHVRNLKLGIRRAAHTEQKG